jgi:hypothetical protein
MKMSRLIIFFLSILFLFIICNVVEASLVVMNYETWFNSSAIDPNMIDGNNWTFRESTPL